MRIVVAGVNYAPEQTGIGPYTTGLAEHLAMRGHDVVVATSFPSFPLWRWYEPPPRWRIREHSNGVEVWRTKVLLPRHRTAVWRIIFDCSVAGTAGLTALSIPRADFAICISPPVQTTIVAAALRFRVGKVVMLVKDLPSEAARSVGLLKNGPLLRVARTVERVAYRTADHIVVISSAFARHIQNIGVDPARITEIPDWAEVERIRPMAADLAVRKRLGAGRDDFLVVHAGNMSAKQDLSNVVAAARILKNHPRIKFALIGDGMLRGKIEDGIARNGLDNITLLPLQPSDEFPHVLAAADVLLLNQAPLIVDSVLPSKLLAYMAAGRPVIASAHTESTAVELINLARCGVVVAPGKPEALAGALRSMADNASGDGELLAMGRQARTFVERHYERSRILRLWDDLLTDLNA